MQGKQNPLIDEISSMHSLFWVRTLSQVDMSGNARNVCPEVQTLWIVFIFKELPLNLLLSKNTFTLLQASSSLNINSPNVYLNISDNCDSIQDTVRNAKILGMD